MAALIIGYVFVFINLLFMIIIYKKFVRFLDYKRNRIQAHINDEVKAQIIEEYLRENQEEVEKENGEDVL